MMKGARGHGDFLSALRAGGSPGTPGTGGSCTPGPSTSRRAAAAFAALAIVAVEFVVDMHYRSDCDLHEPASDVAILYREAGEVWGRVERRDGARVPSCQALAAWRQGGGRCTRIASGASRAGELGMAGRRGMCVQFCTTAGAWD